MKTQIVVRANGSGSLFVDGHDISNAVKAVELVASPGDPKLLVTLELVGDVLATPNTDQVQLSGELQDALLALGWTPPVSDQAVTT